MVSKTQRQLILNLVSEYGDLREKLGRNNKTLFDSERAELNKKIGKLFASIEIQLISGK